MSIRRIAPGLSALLIVGIWLPELATAACPNFPYPPIADRCRRDAHCGWIEPEALIILDGVQELDRQSPLEDEAADPVAFPHVANVGRADHLATSDAAVETDLGFVRVHGDAYVESPRGDGFSASGNGNHQALAVFRARDLVFTGPGADVETSLHVVFDGSFLQRTTGLDGAVAISQVTAFLGGGVCGNASPFGFSGQRTVSQRDDADVDDQVVLSTNRGLLEDVELDEQVEWAVGPFTVPTGQPLEIEIWMQSFLTAATGGGNTRSEGDFSLSIGPLGGGPVFVLPAGYTANSAQAGIVANHVPEPSGRTAALLCGGVLALLAKRRGRTVGARPASGAEANAGR